MRNSKFWLYYSLVMMVGFYPVGAFATNTVEFVNVDSGFNYNSCVNYINNRCSSFSEGINTSICNNIQVLNTGCTGNMFAIFISGDGESFCNSSAVYKANSCNTCPSGQQPVNMRALCEAKVSGANLSGAAATLAGLMGNDNCADTNIHDGGNEFNICVTCEITSGGEWEECDSEHYIDCRTVTIKNICNKTTSTTTEYRCQAGYVPSDGGVVTADTECVEMDCSEIEPACVNGRANCDANCSIISCKKGYFDASGEACNSCDPGTYQPSDNNTEEQDSCYECPEGTYSAEGSAECTPCPAGEYQDQSAQASCKSCASGQYNPYAGAASCLNCPPHIDPEHNLGMSPEDATSITKCYQPSTISFVDDFGTYNFINDCEYSGS